MMRSTRPSLLIAGLAIAMALPGTTEAAFVTFSTVGDSTPASIQGTVDQFRTAVGNPNNGNAVGPISGGRREINWDGGGGVSTSVVSPTPFAGFQDGPTGRGALFTTPSPGNGFIQATPAGLATQFNNPTYSTIFSTFSPLRLFSPIGSNITDVTFSIPGSGGVPATVAGFGAVFTDVNLANTTSIEFFGINGNPIFSGNALASQVSGNLGFLGAVGNAGEQIARVRITTGTTALATNANNSATVDVVAMDDFIYSEPTAVPEPASLVLLGMGLTGVVLLSRRKARRQPAR